MAVRTKPNPEVEHELSLLRGLAAHRRQASWLATLQRRRTKAKAASKPAKATAATEDKVRQW
jgi:hypothetical protein